MIPRSFVGKTFEVRAAKDVTVGSNIIVSGWVGQPDDTKFITEIHLVGDDVEFWSFGKELFTTSVGNAVMVEVDNG